MGKGIRLILGTVVSATLVVSNLALSALAAPPDKEKIGALELAISNQDTNSIAGLLKENTNLCNTVVFWTRRPLIIAASKGWDSIVDLLLKNGAEVNATGDTWDTSNKQLTALQAAIWYNHPAICKRLLAAGANPDLLNPWEGSALHVAFIYKREEMAAWLLDAGADAFLEGGNPYRRSTPFELAIQQGAGELVPRMLQTTRERPNPKAAQLLALRGPELLAVAAQRGELEAVEALLQAGVSAKEKTSGGYSLLQAMSLPQAVRPGANSTPDERRDQIRKLLEEHGAVCDAFATTGFGDVITARRLLAADSGLINLRDPEGQTPLHWAVRADRLPLTSFWLEAGASPGATNSAGQTPLHLAAAQGLAAQVKRLLAANAPQDVRDTNGWTAFDAATQARQTETIRLLLPAADPAAATQRGIAISIHKAAADGNIVGLSALVNPTNINARNELGLTPFQIAIQRGQLGAAAFLFDKGADVNARDPDGNTALHLAIRDTHFTASQPSVAWLARMSQEPKKKAALQYFDENEDSETVNRAVLQAAGLLLACGADATATNKAGKSAIQLVLDESSMIFDEDRPRLSKLLAAAGAKVDQPDADGNTELHRAGTDVTADKVAALLAGGASVNATNHQGRTPLHTFAQKIYAWDIGAGTNEPFQLLLTSKPDVNARDNEGLTPLHVLALADTSFKPEATRALLEAGANPNLRDKHGRTPVHLFLSGEWPWNDAAECVDLLFKAGADLSAKDDQERTPVHYLASLGGASQSPLFFMRNIADTFIAAKVDIRVRDHEGNTPLHLAAKSGSADVFDWLVKRGAGLDVTNNAGETPRMLALHSKDKFSRFRFSPSEDIFAAARVGKLETVKALLKTEPRLLNETNALGQTALRVAVMARQTNVIEFLSGQGAR